MWSVIDTLYGQNIACEKEPRTTDIVGHLYPIEQRLLEWKRALPPSLSIVSAPILPSGMDQMTDLDGLGQVRQLSTILTLRYLNLRLLLHRPVLVKFFEYQNDTMGREEEAMLLQQFGTTSVCQCYQTSTEIVSIVHSAIGVPDTLELLGAWWFTLYYSKISRPCCMQQSTMIYADKSVLKAFNAALINFGCYFVSRPRPGVTTPSVSISTYEVTKTLGEAIEALSLLDRGNRMVERCRHYLQTLSTVLNALGRGSSP